jgi:hypothetical protein
LATDSKLRNESARFSVLANGPFGFRDFTLFCLPK